MDTRTFDLGVRLGPPTDLHSLLTYCMSKWNLRDPTVNKDEFKKEKIVRKGGGSTMVISFCLSCFVLLDSLSTSSSPVKFKYLRNVLS